jgi:hypothetical protein
MRALDIFLVPGKAIVDLIFTIFELSPTTEHAMLLTIAAGVISWIVWVVVIKTLWFITLRLFGFA